MTGANGRDGPGRRVAAPAQDDGRSLLAGAASEAVKSQIRGSSLFVVGRVLSLAINLGVQVMIVRYLAKNDYGAFAYALSLVTTVEVVVTLGLDRTITRFVAIYDEQGEYDKLFGALVLQVGSILVLGTAVILLTVGASGVLVDSIISDDGTASILLILIALAPVQALDSVLLSLFAVFAKPRAIFFRRYLLAPGLRVAVVLLLVLTQSSVFFLAAGYVASGAVGVAIYAVILWRVFGERGLIDRFEVRTISVPFREIFGFTLPMLTTDLLYLSMNTVDAVLLARYGSVDDIAAFRAIQPAARLNQVVLTSFTLLFTPLAARLYARGDDEGISKLYWSTAIWMAIFSFPIFALTSSLSGQVTVTLFGERYSSSATYLALLSCGYYFNAALGFNGLTLKVLGRLRYVMFINLFAGVFNLALNFYLIPRHGALGAAIGTSSTFLLHNVLKQAGLRLQTGIRVFEWCYVKVYAAIMVAALGLWLTQRLVEPGVVMTLVLTGAASLTVLGVGRSELAVLTTFPELIRIPLMGRLLGSEGRRVPSAVEVVGHADEDERA